jgi:hypothetical protein
VFAVGAQLLVIKMAWAPVDGIAHLLEHTGHKNLTLIVFLVILILMAALLFLMAMYAGQR